MSNWTVYVTCNISRIWICTKLLIRSYQSKLSWRLKLNNKCEISRFWWLSSFSSSFSSKQSKSLFINLKLHNQLETHRSFIWSEHIPDSLHHLVGKCCYCKIYLFKLQNIFVQIAECKYFSKLVLGQCRSKIYCWYFWWTKEKLFSSFTASWVGVCPRQFFFNLSQ